MRKTACLLAAFLHIGALANVAAAQSVPKSDPGHKPLIQGYHQRLLVNDYKSEYKFLRDVLGFTPTYGTENDNYADFEVSKGHWFAIFSKNIMSAAIHTVDLPAGARVQDASALIFFVKDVDAAYIELKKRGIIFVTQPFDRKDWGIRVAHFRDPNGNLIEINGELKVK